MSIILDVEDAGQVLVIEIDSSETILLDVPDFLSDDDFLEINHGMLHFDILLIEHFVCIVVVVLHSPSHVWVFLHNLCNDFLFGVVEVLEA